MYRGLGRGRRRGRPWGCGGTDHEGVGTLEDGAYFLGGRASGFPRAGRLGERCKFGSFGSLCCCRVVKVRRG